MAIRNILSINLLFPSLLLINGQDDDGDHDDDDNWSNDSKSGNSAYGSDANREESVDPINKDPENRKVSLRDNPHRAEDIMDSWDEVVKAKNGDQDSLDNIKSEYAAFFDNNTDEEALRQIENYLEEEYDYGRVEEEEEKEAQELDEMVRRAEQVLGKRAHSEENDSNSDSPEAKRQRLWDSNNDNNGRGPGGPGPNSSGNGPESNGPESNGPSPESSSTSSSKIIDVLFGLLLLGGGILDNITEVFHNLFC